MFTGFASENTPAIEVRECSLSSLGPYLFTLSDDCAPIQYVKSGGGFSDIRFFLPSSPIEGKRITIINSRFGNASQFVQIYSSEVRENGTRFPLYQIGQGQRLELFYTKNAISFGASVGAYASGWITLSHASSIEGNAYSFCVGDYNATPGAYAVSIGGSSNTASGNSAAVVGGTSNTASGQRSAVIGGNANSASNTNAAVFGGSSNTASGQNSVTVGGQSSSATTSQAAVFGGISSVANATNSVVVGGGYSTTRSIVANFVSPASNAPISSGSGVQQTALLVLGRQTTDATATVLASNSSAASTTNQVILPNNSAYAFEGTVIANVTGAGDTSSWKFEGAIKRGANAASTVLVAAVTPTVIAQDAGASTWVLAVTADTTNGGIAVTVTGAAATTIRWVCKIETTEVTF